MRYEIEQRFNQVNAIHQMNLEKLNRRAHYSVFLEQCKSDLIQSGFEENSVFVAILDNDRDYRGNFIRQVCVVRLDNTTYAILNVMKERAYCVNDLSEIGVIGTY